MTARFLNTALVRVAGAPIREDDDPSYALSDETARDYLIAKAQDTALARAIAEASPQLSGVLADVRAGKPLLAKRMRSAALSVRRYDTRFRSRTVPFGLFAGVGLARLGAELPSRLEQPQLVTVERPPGRDAELTPTTVLMTNYCVVRRGTLWTLDDDVAAAGKQRGSGECQVRAAPDVDAILSRAIKGATLGRLLAELSRPGEAETMRSGIRQLMAHGYLIPVGDPSDGPRTGTVRDLKVTTSLSVPTAVFNEAQRATETLGAVGPPAIRTSALTDYHQRFVEKFGTGTAVPILILVDSEAGIGYPRHYDSGAPSFAPDAAALHARQEALGDLSSIFRGRAEFELTDSVIARLESVSAAPDTAGDIGFHFAVPKRSQSTTNPPFTLIRSTTGAHGLGTVGGRFRHLLGEQHVGILADEFRSWPERVASPAFWPFEERDAAVAHTANRAAPFTIAIDQLSLNDAEIALPDVVVYSDGSRPVVATADRARPIRIVREDTRSLEHAAPRLARLLWELSNFDATLLSEWSWGALAATETVLPRVRSGDSILRRQQWRLPTELRYPASDPSVWRDQFGEWAVSAGLPRYVEIPNGDQAVTADIRSGLDIEVLRRELVKGRGPWIVESVLNFSGIDFNGGHATELVFSYVHRDAPVAGASRHASVTGLAAGPKPRINSNWLYCKAYSAIGHQSEVLRRFAESLRNPATAGFKWFFVRYRDAEGEHLRIRVEVGRQDASIREYLLGTLRSLCTERLCRAIVIADYEPEFDRYGGAAGMAAAESVFHLDSMLSLTLPPGPEPTDRVSRLAVAARVAVIAEQVIGDGWRKELCSAIDCETRRILTPADRQWHAAQFEAARMSFERSGAGVDRWRSALAGYRKALVAEGFDNSRLTSAARSLMHMHVNRTAGVDRRFEAAVLAVLRCCCEADLNREFFVAKGSSDE
ncbi:thiopeptide-type bacteriocin biosynthesis protein [Streptomyces sp. NPDC004296]|uniref:thiopeptide-type bacteriocin biosynthesis protein n=1 Tax=Streptomyces sp. NPDC004296 TaxID=3364697 RepID=UPI0036853E80